MKPLIFPKQQCQSTRRVSFLLGLFCVSAELKEAVRTWPHTDPLSWAQRTTTVALVKRLDQNLDKAVTALKQNDPKYYRGKSVFPEMLVDSRGKEQTCAAQKGFTFRTWVSLRITGVNQRSLGLNHVLLLSEFEPLLSWTFWLIPQEWCSTDPSLVYSSTMTTECYDEQLSDKCLTLLLGTWYAATVLSKLHHYSFVLPCVSVLWLHTGCVHVSLSLRMLTCLAHVCLFG